MVSHDVPSDGHSLKQFVENPKDYLGDYTSVVLVANSQEAAAALESDRFGRKPLFVFFNRVFSILKTRFERDCILVTRATPTGSGLVYKGEIGRAIDSLDGRGFHGIVNLKAGPDELLNPDSDFGLSDSAALDLTSRLKSLYSADRLPSSGFALAVWLAQARPGIPIYLLGFTGTRSISQRVLAVHDWTWEQTVLHMLTTAGLLDTAHISSERSSWPLARFRSEFPEIGDSDFAKASAQVLSWRLDATNRMVDLVLRSIKPSLAMSRLIDRLRPASRKPAARAKLMSRANPEEVRGVARPPEG
ncbi:hypothetical protein [Fulvimarina sp. MAC8]|uniref:hypothetical protein n=1 Tax=Fulvimarina sp. MAC8 TaxID=3162874 RepID=UPI0032EE65FE